MPACDWYNFKSTPQKTWRYIWNQLLPSYVYSPEQIIAQHIKLMKEFILRKGVPDTSSVFERWEQNIQWINTQGFIYWGRSSPAKLLTGVGVCVRVCVCVCECGGSHLSWVSDVVSSFSWKSFRRSSREKCLSTSSSLSTTQLLRAFLCACRWKIFSSMEPVWWRDHHYSLIWETYMYVVTIWGITIIQKVVYKQLLWLHVSHSRAQKPGIIWLILVSTIYSECTVLQDVPSIVDKEGRGCLQPKSLSQLTGDYQLWYSVQ